MNTEKNAQQRVISNDEIFTMREAAQYLKISYSYLRVLRTTGKIGGRMGPPPARRLDGDTGPVRYLKSDLDRWLRSLPIEYASGHEHDGGEMQL